MGGDQYRFVNHLVVEEDSQPIDAPKSHVVQVSEILRAMSSVKSLSIVRAQTIRRMIEVAEQHWNVEDSKRVSTYW